MSDTVNTVSRRLSASERIWITSDRITPPFVNQMVLEAAEDDPCELDPEAWTRAVSAVAQAHPGSCLRLKGGLRWSRWQADGPRPRVRFVDGSRWDGRGPEGAPFLRERLDPLVGPTTEIVVASGTPTRVIIRTHHGIMDGGGTLTFAEDLFACLRGEAPRGATCGPPLDEHIAAAMGNKPWIGPPRDAPAPTGRADSDEMEPTWLRVSVPGRYGRLLGRVAHAIAELSDTETPGKLRFGTSVDYRRHQAGLRSTGNLTGMASIEMEDVLAADDPPAAFQTALREQIESNNHGGENRMSKLLHWFPLWLMHRLGEAAIRKNYRDGAYDLSVLLSNLGRLDVKSYSGGGFAARRGFFIPPFAPGLPLFIALAGSDDGVELCASTSKALASGGRLQGLMSSISERLQESAASETAAGQSTPGAAAQLRAQG